MIIRATNDNQREEAQAAQFGLTLRSGRSNKYTPDADLLFDGTLLSAELKTFSPAKRAVSTARGVKQKKIDDWREVDLWIFSAYAKGNALTGEHYVLTSTQMEGFFQKMEVKLHQGSSKLAGLADWERAKEFLEQGNFEDSLLQKLDYAFRDKGCALNDPKIPLSYLIDNGTKIRNEKDLKTLLEGKR